MTKIPDFTNKFLNSTAGKWLTNPNAAAGTAVAIATVSNLTKDGVNCAYYVTQSRNNKRIPDDQREFVAGLDLANGILNVSLQSIVGIAITKVVNKVFDNKLGPKYFNEKIYKETYKQLSNKIKYEDFVSMMEKNKAAAKNGLSIISALVGMQVITKRIIVPLIATPMATFFKNKFEESNQRKAEAEKKIKNSKND